MSKQARSARNAYVSTLSSEQKNLFEAVEMGDIPKVQSLFGTLSEATRQEKWLDYVLLTVALQKGHKPVTKLLLNSGCRANAEKKTKFLCTPMYYAIENNDARSVGELMKKGASIRDLDVNKISPLEYAVQTDKIDMIEVILRNRKYLLSHEKLDPNNESDRALLQTACYKNNLLAVKELLELKFPIDTRSSFSKKEWKGFTLLHFSVSGPKGSTVDFLLKSGVDIFAQDDNGRTAIHLAFKNTYRESYNLGKSNLLKNWVRDLVHKDFSNPQDENGNSHFHIICCGCDDKNPSKGIDAVKFFLKNRVNVNKSVSLNDPDHPGYTALHFAVRHVRLSITKLLLDKSADVTKTDKEGLTPLHIACDRSLLPWYRSSYSSDDPNIGAHRLEIAKLLLKNGADVDTQDLRGSTPIHYALSRSSETEKNVDKDQPLTRMLISKSQLNANYTDSNGLTYLHIASSIDLAAVKTLVKNGASLNSCVNADVKFKPGYSALHFAIVYGKVDIVEYLLKNGVDPNIRINQDNQLTPLHLVCKYTYSEAYHPDDSSEHELEDDSQCAVQSRKSAKIRIIELLLKHGASVNAKDSSGKPPLFAACVLPAYTYKRYYESESTIPDRVYTEQRDILDLLLRNGADVHSRSDDKKSVLHVIAGKPTGLSCSKRKKLARAVLMRGADVNARDRGGVTPLHEAVRNSMYERWDTSLVKLFLEYGADVNAGFSLHLAVKNFFHREPSHEKMLLLLIDHPEIDLNSQNSSGETPLHLTGNILTSSLAVPYITNRERAECLVKNRFCIDELLYAGADINVLNSNGQIPMHQLYKWMRENSTWSDQRYLDFLTFIITHMKKLAKINVFVSEEVEKELDALSLLRLERSLAIDIAIDEELDRMKSKKVDQYTSLYDILLKNVNDVSKHVKNEDLKKIITSPELNVEFPLYHEILIRKFKVGSTRSLILEPAKEALGNVLRVSWPDSCSEHILQYLSNDSLKSLAKCIQVENSRKRFGQNEATLGQSQAKISKRR